MNHLSALRFTIPLRFHYRLGPEDLVGLARFDALLGEHGLLAAD